MSFLHMSIAGAAMILAITVIRALAINRVPKKTFLVLWGAVLLRLLIPFSLPSRLSIYALLARKTAPVMPNTPVAALNAGPTMQALSASPQPVKVNGAAISGWGLVWAVGLLACAAVFAVAYWKCYREFQTSLPVDNAVCRRWLQAHPLRRAMTIRQSDRISSPLTFGMLRPVILMPKKTDWQDERTLQYVLEHEFVHIRRFDVLSKLLLIAAACVHWFNPLVWVMYVLANRDLELSCDESVVRYFGGGTRAAYANVLISMEETKSGFAPLCNHFSKNAIEERITAIMKIKKTTILSLAAAAVLVAGTVTAFATSAPIPNGKAGAITEENSSAAWGGAEAFATGEGLKPRAEYVAVGITEKEKLWYYQGKPIAAIYDDNSGIYMDDKAEDGVYLNIKRGDNGSVTDVEVITRKQFRELVDRHMRLNPPESTMDEWSIISYVDAADGKTYYSFDDGKTFTPLTDAEFERLYPTPDIEWWTYDGYKAWLDNERVQLQSMLGEKGWTSGRGDFIWTQEMINETISLYEGILADIKNGALYSKSMDGQDDVLVSYNPADVAASTDTGKQ